MKRMAIAVVADETLLLFSSIEAAESRVEPSDIRAAAGLVAFDRAGRVHRFAVHDNGWGIETVRLVAIAGETPRPRELRERLARRLTEAGIAVRPTHTLDDLLERIAGFVIR